MSLNPPSPAGNTSRITISDVAKRAAVDPAVVSKVLNGDPGLRIRPETRQRVTKAVEELGYRPNSAARSLRTARAHAYGLMIPNYSNPVYAAIIQGAESAARARGCALLTSSMASSPSDHEAHLSMLESGRIDGLLLGGALAAFEPRILVELASGTPVLLVNRRSRNSRRYVILDDQGAARLAVEHLQELGHARIAHVAGPADADTARRRAAGYRATMRDAGLRIPQGYVMHASYDPAEAVPVIRRALQLSPRPTAIFCGSMATAVAASHTIRRSGFRVPDDISVVTIHDVPWAAYFYPALTTVQMPLFELGKRAIELIADEPPEAPIAEVVKGPMHLLVRESTAAV